MTKKMSETIHETIVMFGDVTEAGLWHAVFLAMIQQGTGQEYAEWRADLALAAWRKRNLLSFDPGSAAAPKEKPTKANRPVHSEPGDESTR